MKSSRGINAFGATLTGIVLVVVLITKFALGAYIVCIAMPLLFLLMKAIRKHYDRVAEELVPSGEDVALPARNHGIVLVSKIHKPTLRALAYARATRPSTLEAVTVAVDAAESRRLQQEWDALDIPVPLKILDSPYREITRPVLAYVKNVRRRSPRRRHRVHPRVRRRPLVGAAAAQPERAAAQGAAAVPAGRHGDERRVAAPVVRPAQGTGRTARPRLVPASAADRDAPGAGSVFGS